MLAAGAGRGTDDSLRIDCALLFARPGEKLRADASRRLLRPSARGLSCGVRGELPVAHTTTTGAVQRGMCPLSSGGRPCPSTGGWQGRPSCCTAHQALLICLNACPPRSLLFLLLVLPAPGRWRRCALELKQQSKRTLKKPPANLAVFLCPPLPPRLTSTALTSHHAPLHH